MWLICVNLEYGDMETDSRSSSNLCLNSPSTFYNNLEIPSYLSDSTLYAAMYTAGGVCQLGIGKIAPFALV